MERLVKIREALLGEHQVRKSYEQKSRFIEWVTDYAEKNGYKTNVEESGKIVRTRNIVFGDLSKAKTLVTAHYDTCAKMPFPNFLTPNNWLIIALTQLLIPVALFMGLGFGIGYLCGSLFSDELPIYLASVLPMLLYFGVCALLIGPMLFGKANPHTANDNTSGVASVLMLMKDFAGREDVALVLFDNEEIGLLGSSAFAKKHPALAKTGFVVNLDCVSDGETLMYAYAKKAADDPRAKAILSALKAIAPQHGMKPLSGPSSKIFYPSDQMAFKHGTAFAALKGKKILYLDRIHTDKDTVFEERNLLCLNEVLSKAL